MSLGEGAEFPDKELQLGGEPLPYPRALKILAVDHSPDTLAVLEPLLLRSGYRVFTAADGNQAVAEFTRHEPDLVLVECAVPGFEGFEATRRIKALSADKRWVPVIMFTAPDRPEDFEHGLRAGADDYLIKPFDARQLAVKMTLMKRVLALQLRLIELKRFQTLFDHLLDGVVVTDARGTVVSFNRAAGKIFGYPADEILGRNVSMLMSIPDAHRHDAYMARYRSTCEPTVMGVGRDIFGRRKDGSLVPISVGLSEVAWAGARHFIGVVSDISERKRVEHMQQHAAAKLQQYHDRNEEEKRITRELVDRIVRRGELDDPLLQWHVSPSEIFSGDIIAARRAPDGRLFLLSADATGHGLAAAISLLPVAGIFYAMVDKGFSVSAIVAEMNKRLHETMPVGRFLAASIVAVDERQRLLEIWNGGMPENLLCSGNGAQLRLKPRHVALGIEPPECFDASCQQLHWEHAGYLVALSDGVVEAQDRHGAALGMEGVCSAAARAENQSPFLFILENLERHLGGGVPHDDISLAVIRLN